MSESDAERVSLLSALASGRVPSKVLYMGSGLPLLDQLGSVRSSAQLGDRAADEVLALRRLALDQFDVLVDIGPSNGVHSSTLLALMSDTRIPKLPYYAFDLEQELLNSNQRERSRRGLEEATNRVWDFEQSPTEEVRSTAHGVRRLVLLTGNTLGNVENPVTSLCNIASSLGGDDVLVVGVSAELQEETSEHLLAPYTSLDFERLLLNIVLRAGFEDSNWSVEIETRGPDVVAYLIARCTQESGGFELRRGHKSMCFISRRFTTTRLSQMTLSSGWRIVDLLDGEKNIVATLRQEP